mmetsp:Transcript_9869/g.14450  ORF Transcript_9869/g.14450 Transcript_9869/m.14450 type:complete len:237 (-) Transcript_9869:9-719(-)
MNHLLILGRRSVVSTCSNASRRSASLISSHSFSSEAAPPLPDSVKRVGETFQFPNEYPGQNYLFNWSLNYDGVTPTKKSAFRITKPLDLKIAGLAQPKTSPLKVIPAKGSVPEAGSDDLSFERFDEASQKVKDALSVSNHLYVPEGHPPGTRVGVRIICNSPTLASNLVAYLERAPKKDPPPNQPITVYAYEGPEQDLAFEGYAIEIAEEKAGDAGDAGGPKSVAAVVVAGGNLHF